MPRIGRGWPSASRCRTRRTPWTPSSAPSSAPLAGAVMQDGGPGGGDAWQAAIFATAAGRGLPPGRAFAALYLAFLGRPNGPRAGWLLAGLRPGVRRARGCARQPPGVRRCRPQEVRRERGAGEAPGGAGRDPEGRARQGRGPVTSSMLPSRRTPVAAPSRARATRSAPSGTRRRSRSASRSRVAPARTDRRSRRSAPARPPSASASPPSTPSSPRPRHRSRTCSSGSRTRPSWTSQSAARRPTSRSGPGASSSRGSSRSRARSGRTRCRTARTWERRPHWDVAEALGIIDLARGAKIAGSGFPVYRGAGSALQRALIMWFLDVHTPRERVHRDLAAGRRQPGVRPRDRPDPGQGRPDVRRHPRRPVPGPDGRGPGHEPPPRRDPRGGRAPDPLCRLHALLPAGGRRRRQGHPRASSGSTSSTRWRWSCSRSPRRPPRPSSG